MAGTSAGRVGDRGAGVADGVGGSIEWMRKHFDGDAAADANFVYQVELTGAGGGEYALSVSHGRLGLEPGRTARPDVLLRVRADDWLAILHGRENADLLYLAGRLEIQGDLGAATRLRTFFRG